MSKYDKIRGLLAKLDARGNVSMRDLRNTLGDSAVDEYESRWSAELERRSQFENKPDCIKDYEELLRRADFLEMRADTNKQGSRTKRDMHGRTSNERLRHEAESIYEDALIRAEEIVTADQSMCIWFDRTLDFTTNGDMYACASGVPRVVTSRSDHKRSNGAAKHISKEEIKRQMLEEALNADEARELTAEDEAMLKEKLAKLKKIAYR